jgi:hypothetical protein
MENDLAKARAAATEASMEAVTEEWGAEVDDEFLGTPHFIMTGAWRLAARAAESTVEEDPVPVPFDEGEYQRQGGYISPSPGTLRLVADAQARAATALARSLDPSSDRNEVFYSTVARASEEQAHLVRDVSGNPFESIHTNLGPTTSSMLEEAHRIYDERAFNRMPALGDALEQAGYSEKHPLVQHCRSPRAHIRGCYALDLLLGRK